MHRAVEFARQYTEISEDDVNIIMHCRKCLLFSGNDQWVKKDGNEMFDVTMGSFDGAEVCELVGLYLLSKIANVPGIESVGLYRDDGLSCIRSTSGRILDRLRKDLSDLFKAEGLSITCETNLRITDFLDVTFNMDTGKFYPYRKPNSEALYINTKSNHPQTIKKQLPAMISNRLSDLSCDEQVFNQAKDGYETSLRNSGYDTHLKFEPKNERRRRHTRKRKVIWYNPPYSSHVRTDIGRKFLRMVDRHFPRGHRYAKIFNRNTLKLSYSCMPNMATVIKNHNNSVLKSAATNTNNGCNCTNKPACPLNGECLTPCITYAATVTIGSTEKIYYGSTQGPFKTRFNRHNFSFRHRENKTDTRLSELVWDLTDQGKAFSIKWSVVSKSHPYVCGSNRCDLCLTEKLIIARSNHPGMLNKRSELMSKCRHRNKFLLASVK